MHVCLLCYLLVFIHFLWHTAFRRATRDWLAAWNGVEWLELDGHRETDVPGSGRRFGDVHLINGHPASYNRIQDNKTQLDAYLGYMQHIYILFYIDIFIYMLCPTHIETNADTYALYHDYRLNVIIYGERSSSGLRNASCAAPKNTRVHIFPCRCGRLLIEYVF